jgi:hypothetical protein
MRDSLDPSSRGKGSSQAVYFFSVPAGCCHHCLLGSFGHALGPSTSSVQWHGMYISACSGLLILHRQLFSMYTVFVLNF